MSENKPDPARYTGARRRCVMKPFAWKYLRSNLLTVLTLLSIIFGISFGLILRNCREDKWSQRETIYVMFGGDVFLRMLRALSLPLILSSVIASLGSLDLKLCGKVGLRTLLFYLLTTVCAVFLGIVLVVAIHPGGEHHEHDKLEAKKPIQVKPGNIFNTDVLMDMVRNMFPSNLVQATMYQYETIKDIPTLESFQRDLNKNASVNQTALKYSTRSKFAEGTNMLGLLIFSSAFGIALASLGTYGKPFLKVVRCLSQLMMIISNWVLWLTPIGMFCLLAGATLGVKDIEASLAKTGSFVFTVLLGMALHGFVVLPGIYFLICGKHPFKLFGSALQALLTAFGTASSIAALPATVSCVEDKHGVDPRVARFVLPIGAAMNMDGTALYEAVAAFFLVQLHGISMDFGSIVAVCVLATVSTFGTTGIPSAGFVTMSMIMNVLGLPVESIAILFPVDWMLHRFRTALNVLGDAMAASLVHELSKDELDQLPDTKIITQELSTSGVEEDV